jgi:hypothetical protein
MSSFSSRETSSWEATGRSGCRSSAGDGERVDRVGLAPCAGDAELLGHHLRRHPHHCLASGEQVALEPGGQVAAVLDRPGQLVAELLPGPPDRVLMAGRGRRDRPLTELAADGIDRDERVRALVYIGTDNNHEGCLPSLRGMVGPVGGHISVGAMPRSYQVTPAGPSHPAPAKRVQISRRRQALYEPGTGCSGSNQPR